MLRIGRRAAHRYQRLASLSLAGGFRRHWLKIKGGFAALFAKHISAVGTKSFFDVEPAPAMRNDAHCAPSRTKPPLTRGAHLLGGESREGQSVRRLPDT